MLLVVSPKDFAGYFKALSEGLRRVGNLPEEAMRLRHELSQMYDIEVVGPPRQRS